MITDITTLRNDSLSFVAPLINKINHVDNCVDKLLLMKRLCHHFHILALGSIYIDCKPLMFKLNLCRAAENWRRMHIVANKIGFIIPSSALISILFGCIVAKNSRLTHQLVMSLDSAFYPENEYAEDYEYSIIMRLLVLNDKKNDALLTAHIEKYSGLVSDEAVYRVPLIDSLLSNNQQNWDDAFEDALGIREDFIEKKARNFSTSVTDFAVDRSLWLEGLAFIHLAETRGLLMKSRNVIYCPSLARKSFDYSYDNDWVIEI